MNAPTLAEMNALLAQCGCCEHPRCCPPRLQCRSAGVHAHRVGFVKPPLDSDSDEVPQFMMIHYLKKTHGGLMGADETTYDTYPPAGAGGGGSYVSRVRVDSRSAFYVQEYDRSFNANISCIMTPDAVYKGHCVISGEFTDTFYQAYREDVAEGESIGANANFRSATHVERWVSAAGERRKEHIEWEAEGNLWDLDHPDYPAEIATHEAAHAVWQADYDAWEIAWTLWDNEGQVGVEPVFEDVEPQLADPREQEPAEFYPECTLRLNITYTNWERVNPGEGWTIRLVPEEEDYPNPRTESYIHGQVVPNYDEETVSYETAVTYEDFIALVETWSAENVVEAFARSELEQSDSDYCAASDICGAYKFYGDAASQPYLTLVFEARLFQYRWKLNKCCGFASITSGWREVYWPLEYMQWLAEVELLGSDDPIPPPPVDLEALAAKKQWLWTGAPPLCPLDSDSADSDTPPLDPYDHEPMWSPWSAIVEIPVGERGRKGLRNYFQNCYGPLKDFMPQVTGEVDFSDDLPDDFA
jgi:hypothetical protein